MLLNDEGDATPRAGGALLEALRRWGISGAVNVGVAADLTAKLELRRCQSRTERSTGTICCLQHSSKTYLWTQSKEH